jgi:hypothetical protein
MFQPIVTEIEVRIIEHGISYPVLERNINKSSRPNSQKALYPEIHREFSVRKERISFCAGVVSGIQQLSISVEWRIDMLQRFELTRRKAGVAALSLAQQCFGTESAFIWLGYDPVEDAVECITLLQDLIADNLP